MDLPAARLENWSKPHAIPLLGMPQASVYDPSLSRRLGYNPGNAGEYTTFK